MWIDKVNDVVSVIDTSEENYVSQSSNFCLETKLEFRMFLWFWKLQILGQFKPVEMFFHHK